MHLSGEWDDTELNIFVIKENDYNIMMMSIESGLTFPDEYNGGIIMVKWEVLKLKYPEIVYDNYRYREDQWKITMHWGMMVEWGHKLVRRVLG